MRRATAPGISRALARLFRCAGQVAYALLTHSPLGSRCRVLARLACIRHSTSVRSEPGSNSSLFSKVCPARFSSRSSTGASLKHISKSFNKPARRLVRGVLGLPDRNDANYRNSGNPVKGFSRYFRLFFTYNIKNINKRIQSSRYLHYIHKKSRILDIIGKKSF